MGHKSHNAGRLLYLLLTMSVGPLNLDDRRCLLFVTNEPDWQNMSPGSPINLLLNLHTYSYMLMFFHFEGFIV